MVYRDMEIGDGEFYIFFTFLLLLFMEKFDFFFFFCLGVFVQVGWSMDMEIVFTGFFLQVHIFEAVIAYAIENYIGLVFYLFCSFFLSAPPRPRGRSWDLNAWFVYCGVQCNLQIRITVWNILAELFFFFCFFCFAFGRRRNQNLQLVVWFFFIFSGSAPLADIHFEMYM